MNTEDLKGLVILSVWKQDQKIAIEAIGNNGEELYEELDILDEFHAWYCENFIDEDDMMKEMDDDGDSYRLPDWKNIDYLNLHTFTMYIAKI